VFGTYIILVSSLAMISTFCEEMILSLFAAGQGSQQITWPFWQLNPHLLGNLRRSSPKKLIHFIAVIDFNMLAEKQ
jgi:hypothetical protein